MKRTSRAGFTLTELVIAMLLSSFVLLAILNVSSHMVRFQVEGMKKGTVTGWSLVAITAMNKEIEDGTVLVYPTGGTGGQDKLSFCKNYSHIPNAGAGGALDTAVPIEQIDYCYDGASPGNLRRRSATGSCPVRGTEPPACPSFPELVATGVQRDASSNPVFSRDDTVGGVHVRFRVGARTPAPGTSDIKALDFDFKLAMNKQYYGTDD